MADFSISKRFASVGDIVRTYNFEVLIPPASGSATEDDLTIRANTATIPQRGNENSIETVFMGQKQFFPGKPVFSHSLSVEFDEFEDRKVSDFLYTWQERIHSMGKGSATDVDKYETTVDITLLIYGFDGKVLPKNGKILFKNAWIQDMSEVALAYTDSAGLKITAMFQYDYWTYV